MARALPPASFVREAPNNQSAVPVTATRHCPVPVLPRRAKTSFPGREAGPLRFAASSAWVQKRSWAGLHPASASAATLCWRGATRRLGLCDPHSSGTARQHTQQDGRAALATPATGHRRPPRKTETQKESAENRCRCCRSSRVLACSRSWGQQPGECSGSWPRLPQYEPGDLDGRDSGGENQPTLWAAPILVLFWTPFPIFQGSRLTRTNFPGAPSG